MEDEAELLMKLAVEEQRQAKEAQDSAAAKVRGWAGPMQRLLRPCVPTRHAHAYTVLEQGQATVPQKAN